MKAAYHASFLCFLSKQYFLLILIMHAAQVATAAIVMTGRLF